MSQIRLYLDEDATRSFWVHGLDGRGDEGEGGAGEELQRDFCCISSLAPLAPLPLGLAARLPGNGKPRSINSCPSIYRGQPGPLADAVAPLRVEKHPCYDR
jgi:hypothetical protein